MVGPCAERAALASVPLPARLFLKDFAGLVTLVRSKLFIWRPCIFRVAEGSIVPTFCIPLHTHFYEYGAGHHGPAISARPRLRGNGNRLRPTRPDTSWTRNGDGTHVAAICLFLEVPDVPSVLFCSGDSVSENTFTVPEKRMLFRLLRYWEPRISGISGFLVATVSYVLPTF